jgi:uncharacterized membrane protein YphA (DoxX/SURF4 family)
MTIHAKTTSRNTGYHWGNIGLWTLQVLVAGLFLFAGTMKFVMPVEAMTQQIALPGWFLHFIGACEVLGGLGLILPGALRIRRGLTPLAAALLVPIMVGATVLSVQTGGIWNGVVPAVVGLVCAFIAYRRSKTLRAAARSSRLQTAG